MTQRYSINISEVEHAKLLPYLAKDPVTQVYPGVVCSKVPTGASLAATIKGEVVGTAVSGLKFGLFTIPAFWVVANGPEIAASLLQRLRTAADAPSVEIAAVYRSILVQEFPSAAVSEDLLFVCDQAKFIPQPLQAYEVVRLASVPPASTPEELRRQIGKLDDFDADPDFFGLMIRGQIVAIAETMLSWQKTTVVQQVYTLEAHRRHGYSRQLVAHLTQKELAHGRKVAYLVDRLNTASVSLAKGLGFQLVASFLTT